jgi:SAM-dependent methyltransferase
MREEGMDRTSLDSGLFWKRKMSRMLDEGIPDKWSESVFERSLPLADAFVSGLAEGASVLDFGCGLGRNALWMARRGLRVYACDVAEDAVDHCVRAGNREGLEIAPLSYDGWTIGVRSDSFDGLLAWSCLDHVTLDWARSLVGELARVARRGSLLLVSFDEDKSDDPESEVEVLPDRTHHYTAGRREGMLFRPYGNEEIRDLFREGWETLEWEGDDMTVPRRALLLRH